MIKAALTKIASGLLTGIGFAIAMVAIFYGTGRWADSHRPEESFYKKYKPDSGLIIKDHRPQQLEQNTVFIGSVQNNGKDSWDSISIVAELFDKDDKFVDKCSSYETGRVAPGQSHNFKVSCGGCRDSTVAPYDHYTIAIVDANYVPSSK